MYKTILTHTEPSGVTTVSLNRPDVHNAFDEIMIGELHQALEHLGRDRDTRVILIRAMGKSFCAGADLRWMKRAAAFSEEENYDDAMRLAQLLHTLDTLPKPTVAFVHGPAYGGGVGLISCCDIAVASERAVFCLSEVKLGLVPAVISPYVVRAIGARAARRYFQSAERFDCREAHHIGLVHEVAAADSDVESVLGALLQGGPNAQKVSKQLISRVEGLPTTPAMIEDTASTIAAVRASDEGREGLRAFFDKRNSSWNKGNDR